VAKLVAILATTHHPFYYRTNRLPTEEAPPFVAEWIRRIAAYREALNRVRPDVLVMVGSAHFHQPWARRTAPVHSSRVRRRARSAGRVPDRFSTACGMVQKGITG